MTDSIRASERILLTGLTGLVGSSVVVALAKERPESTFVCLVRGAGGLSAVQRAQDVIRSECEFEGCPEICDEVLSRVTAIEGDVTSIEVDQLAANPLLKGVQKVLHCAADVNLGKDPTGRVFKINYDGTRRMVELAKKLDVREFHYVATAYVAGKQTGVIYEQEQHPPAFNNPYEESKCKAEHLVRESGIPFTIYRPGIIVGRKSDGGIRKPLAFYDWMESQRRELMGLGAGYLGTEFWCNMSPALRFELCHMAVADPDIAPLLKGLGSRNQRVRESENWLALAQVAAMHANDDALFVQLYRLKPALAQRRIH